jgi:peptidoglycan/LPS O-acetylase OafA/YrhL
MNKQTTRSPIQQVVLSVLLTGVAIAYVLLGHEPGWQAYVISGVLAVGFLIASLAMWRGSNWLGLMALAALLLAMFWKEGRPLNAVVGLVLAILSGIMTFSRSRQKDDDQPHLRRPDQNQTGDIETP